MAHHPSTTAPHITPPPAHPTQAVNPPPAHPPQPAHAAVPPPTAPHITPTPAHPPQPAHAAVPPPTAPHITPPPAHPAQAVNPPPAHPPQPAHAAGPAPVVPNQHVAPAAQAQGRNQMLANWVAAAPARMDCFFVTIARLMGGADAGWTPQKLSVETGVPIPAPGSPAGISAQHIFEIINKVGLWVVTYGGPLSNPVTSTEANAYNGISPNELSEYVGVGYLGLGHTANGHVVVCQNPGKASRGYLDYQNMVGRQPKNVTAEVQASQIYFVFGVRRMEVDQQGLGDGNVAMKDAPIGVAPTDKERRDIAVNLARSAPSAPEPDHMDIG
ncbi:hypothetical protein B0H16DRAFT_1486516 [Mycena metata]|uniref:Uncharacterized protein n=1 Tax=Mycena metata TaxID=1033252 RepID=A0AAD7GKM8_9AGAR|nr:hypothetical protein B0H16DRAFT_1486516 [Mycena metata]